MDDVEDVDTGSSEAGWKAAVNSLNLRAGGREERKLRDGGGDRDVEHERNHGNAGRVREAIAVFDESEDEIEIELLDGNGGHSAE